MDTSEKYIKMCEKAKEIQKEIRLYDVYAFLTEHGKYKVGVYGGERIFKATFLTNAIFLPRQDQLQEMIDWSSYGYPISMQCYKIDTFYKTLNYFPESMEQLWLAFVMKEKYGKVWNDEKGKWIKND